MGTPFLRVPAPLHPWCSQPVSLPTKFNWTSSVLIIFSSRSQWLINILLQNRRTECFQCYKTRDAYLNLCTPCCEIWFSGLQCMAFLYRIRHKKNRKIRVISSWHCGKQHVSKRVWNDIPKMLQSGDMPCAGCRQIDASDVLSFPHKQELTWILDEKVKARQHFADESITIIFVLFSAGSCSHSVSHGFWKKNPTDFTMSIYWWKGILLSMLMLFHKFCQFSCSFCTCV